MRERGQGQHGTKHLAQWREIVVGNPFPQPYKLLIQHGRGVEDAEYILGLHLGRAIMQCGDHAGHALLAKRNQHAPADHRLHPVWSVIGEGRVEWDGERDVAEISHAEWKWLIGIVTSCRGVGVE